MKFAFFFGAGASACADMPTTDKMLEFLDKDQRFAVLHRYRDFQDIEQIYTYLEDLPNPLLPLFMIQPSNNHDNPIYQNKSFKEHGELTKYSEQIKQWQESFMKKIQNYLVERLDPAPHTVRYYTDLLEKLQEIDPKHSLKIITTNYDLLLDKSFNGNWIDGFVTDIEGAMIKTWQDKWDYDPSKPTLVKLHGSINWEDTRRHKKPKNRNIQKYPNALQTPAMLPLTLKDKDYSDEPYKGMFTQFKQIVADVDLLVVVGYTFRDQKIYDIIRWQLEKNLHVLLLATNVEKTVSARFKKTDGLRISEIDGNVYCNTKNDSRVYYCDIKFGDDTIDDVVKLIKRMSEMIDTNIVIPHDRLLHNSS